MLFPENLLPREILPHVVPFLEEENVILLTGARQTGKTCLLYLLIRHLLKQGIPPGQIVFFDLENIHDCNLLQNLEDFNDFWPVLADRGVDRDRRVFVFIDEIQHLDNPSSFLKYLHDHFKPRLKFIVSGSSSLEIRQKFSDRLTGRIYRFPVRPLCFREYLLFKGESRLAGLLADFSMAYWIASSRPEICMARIDSGRSARLDELIQEYLIYGGYPAVSLRDRPPVRQKDLQEIYSLYIRRDIKDIGKIDDVSGYNRLVSLLCLQIGNLVNEHELAVSSGLSRPTVRKYLFLLENTYVLKLVRPFFTNKRSEISKTPKVFFEDVGLRNGAINNFAPLDRRADGGAILENFVFSQLARQDNFREQLRYWRSQSRQEVDFIWEKEINVPVPVEVKTKHHLRQPLPPGLKSFITRYHPERALIIHRGGFGSTSFEGTEILLLPAWAV